MSSSKLLIALTMGSLVAGISFAGNQGTTLTGTKTAATTETQTSTYSWTVQKTLIPRQVPYIIKAGQTVPVDFLVTATRGGPVVTSVNTPVTGQVCLNNTGTQPTVGLFLTDQLEQSTDGGLTWTAYSSPITIPVVDLGGALSICYPYSFPNQLNPLYLYRNHAVASVDNFLGFEGTSHSIDIYATVSVTTIPITVDSTASLVDVFTCPVGFTCTPLITTSTLTGSMPTTTYTVSLTNLAALCGLTLQGTNTATLTPLTTLVPQIASGTATIFTGSCI